LSHYRVLNTVSGLNKRNKMVKKELHTDRIREKVISLIREASFELPVQVRDCFRRMRDAETSPVARVTLDVILENADIAASREIALCQDCGAVVVFLELGQDVCLEGPALEDAVNSGVEEAYRKYNLRKSIVGDPLRRTNTGTNTPSFIHTDIVAGDRVRISLYLKGGGSENMSSLRMFRPTDPDNAIIDYIEETVIEAGPNPCPPLFVGVGIGGPADVAMINAKRAVLRGAGTEHPDPYYRDLEKRILERLNATGVGPLGFGGGATAGGVFIKTAPAHIATLPVALNLNCHSFRYRTVEL